MDMKEFFKPTILKLVLAIILLFVSSVPDLTVQYPEAPTKLHGFPFNFYLISGCSNTVVPECSSYGPRYNIVNFILDILFWYAISLILIKIYETRLFFKPNINRILVTIGLVILLFILGLVLFNDLIFFNKGCAYNPDCPTCEMCLSLPLQEKIRFPVLFIIFPIYLVACGIDGFLLRNRTKI
jgi:hypothetical protein